MIWGSLQWGVKMHKTRCIRVTLLVHYHVPYENCHRWGGKAHFQTCFGVKIRELQLPSKSARQRPLPMPQTTTTTSSNNNNKKYKSPWHLITGFLCNPGSVVDNGTLDFRAGEHEPVEMCCRRLWNCEPTKSPLKSSAGENHQNLKGKHWKTSSGSSLKDSLGRFLEVSLSL